MIKCGSYFTCSCRRAVSSLLFPMKHHGHTVSETISIITLLPILTLALHIESSTSGKYGDHLLEFSSSRNEGAY